MAALETYRQIIEKVLTEYASIPYAYGDIQTETVFDRTNDHYLLVNVGWQNDRRVHGSLVHIDIINGKVWIQRDGTEHGIANDLVQGGIPKDQIVLGFHAPEVRQYTDFAVA
ncbi:MAG: XisI protein [Chloroflexi bacterium]|nr:XisI protein [Chloroflexota bacterium]MCI0648214.1 XisI protein [Chloroflexota bacterium]MCI0726443.1 XisI protein [Chloroflexota bacterium]